MRATIPMTRLVDVEVRKMLDTRAGAWLLISVALVAALVVGAVTVWGRDDEVTFASFTRMIAFPMQLVLPMVAVLAVTSEWNQRSALTTFALVPRRGRVVVAKGVAAVTVALLAGAVELVAAAGGTVAASAFRGISPVWDLTLEQTGRAVLLNVVALAVGFGFAVLIRASAPALVAYLGFMLVLPSLSGLVASLAPWWAAHGTWLDLSLAMSMLTAPDVTGEQWAQLGTASLVWIGVPLVVGMRRLLRAEIR
ncbi:MULTISPECIES: ABC transporter permease [unclassified Isoptericola]|uniref:ABC transporter permease n=1 Tax=Isoptericola sp. NPDC057191 TaxID=3346041 RepID=UPI003625D02D